MAFASDLAAVCQVLRSTDGVMGKLGTLSETFKYFNYVATKTLFHLNSLLHSP